MDAIFTMRASLQKRFRFQKDTWVLFVDFDKAFDTVPREMLFKVLARLGFPLKIINLRLVRVFHENVTLEVDLDDDGNTIIIKYDIDIGVKQGDTLAPVLFLCYIQVVLVLETLFPKFEAAGLLLVYIKAKPGALRCKERLRVADSDSEPLVPSSPPSRRVPRCVTEVPSPALSGTPQT